MLFLILTLVTRDKEPTMDLTTAKVVSMLALGLGSFFTGMLPAAFPVDSRQRHPLLVSCLLCFGGGVLLSTALVHMLPEAKEKMPENTELLFCIGFFIVYLVDEIVHLFYRHSHSSGGIYGSDEQTSLLRCQDGELRERDVGSSRISHNHAARRQIASGIVGLLGALFVHSILEGLAIGLQDSSSEVLLLLAAVSSHKFVVGFCLGAELCDSFRGRICVHVACIILFSGGSVAGIAMGAGLDHVRAFQDSSAVPIMQALAAGTLLYVTVSEVLPRERARFHERRRLAGFAQFVAVLVGFTLMYLTTKYLDHDAD